MSAIIRRVVIAVTFMGDDSMRQARHSHALCPARKILRKEGRHMTKLWLCLASCCIFIFTLTAVGQVQNGQFQGTVTDPSGAAISAAKVTISNSATGLSVNTVTNSSGFYVVKELPPGAYKI